MKSPLPPRVALLLAGLALLLPAQPAYRIIDLGLLGGSNSLSISVDEFSRVVGRAENAAGDDHGFVWSGGPMADIGALPGEMQSEARDINNRGDICGTSGDRLVLWLPEARYGLAAGINDLGNLGGGVIAPGHHGINDAGQICGQAQTAGGNFVPFLWLPSPAFGLGQGLNPLPGLTFNAASRASAINDAGVVSGYSTQGPGGTIRWTVWMPGGGPPQAMDLGMFGEGLGIAEGANLIIAGYTLVGGVWHATQWTPGGGFVDIHDSTAFPAGFGWSFAYDVNSSGTTVGFATTDASFATRRAYVWDAANGMRDLNDLIDPASGWELNDVRRINEAGQISGFGSFNGQTRAFLLNPNRLEFGAAPNPATAGQSVLVGATDGDPGGTALLGLTAVNGMPLNPPVLLFGVPLDGQGNWFANLNLPAALSGFDVTLLGITTEAGSGALVFSDPLHLVIL